MFNKAPFFVMMRSIVTNFYCCDFWARLAQVAGAASGFRTVREPAGGRRPLQ